MQAGVYDGENIKLVDIPKPKLTEQEDLLRSEDFTWRI